VGEKSLANSNIGFELAAVNISNPLAYAPRVVEVVLVLMLAWLVTSWWVNAPTQDLKQTTHSQQGVSIVLDAKVIQKITDTALFGVMRLDSPSIKVAAPKVVVASRLDIKLLGTVVAGERSAAVVALKGAAKQQVFFLHGTIQSGVILDAVEVDAIVVDNHGKSERINLHKEKNVGQYMPSEPVFQTNGNPSQRILRRSNLNAQVRNFPKLLSQARVVPYFEQGKAQGFVISDIVPNSLYQQIGLQNGDVIQKVNGQAVTSAEQAMAMYQSLQNAAVIDLELKRAGSIVPIHYDIQ